MANKNNTVTTTGSQKTNTQQQSHETQKTQSSQQSGQQSQSSRRNVLDSELLSLILGGLADVGYTQRTTEELKQIAQDMYAPQYNAEVEAAKQAQASKDLSYAQQLENMERTYGKNVQTQNTAFDKSRAALETGALSRGMGRSSYALSTLNNNDQARSAALAELAEGYAQSTRQVGEQRTQAASQLADTLRRMETDRATNERNQLTQLLDTEYQRYMTGQNQKNSNYLAAVQAAMGQQTNGNTAGWTTGQQTSVTDALQNTLQDVITNQTQTTQYTGGGSGSGSSGSGSSKKKKEPEVSRVQMNIRNAVY